MFIALFGKPSVGKSSFFKAATLAEAEIANYPFTTLKSQEGIAYVKVKCIEGEFKVKCTPRFGYCINENRFVPIKLTDIPGLIEGSHIGAGRGNEFLTSTASADALIHIIDISGSTNEKGEAVEPLSYDPLNDVKFLYAKLNPTDDYDLLTPTKVYVGKVDSDDYSTVQYRIYVKDTAKDKITLPLTIEYKDINNNDYTKDLVLDVKLYSTKEALKLGLENRNQTWIYILIVIIIIAAFIFFRSRKKKNK